MSTEERDPTTTGMSSCRPVSDGATTSVRTNSPLTFDRYITWTLILLISLVAIDSTKAFAPDVAPTISFCSKLIKLVKLSALTSMY